ncbi:hypothetical protein ACXR0O_19840 [Verrucomicrobiota bacterium sgz303538]
MNQDPILRRIRLIVAIFIIGLVLSGVTAFPLQYELGLMAKVLGLDAAADPSSYSGLHFWIATVWKALRETGAQFPFLAYGTDWLAFGHITISLFFIPVMREPVRYRGNLVCGLWACAMVFPLALICGPIRGIPFYWRLIDCSFGLFGAIPLLYVIRLTDRLATLEKSPREDYTSATKM